MISKWWNIEIVSRERLLHYSMIILCHISLIYLIVTGRWEKVGWAILIGYVISQVCISFMYHRVLTHNAVKVPFLIEVILTLLGGLSLQGSTLGWVATHNAHHKYQGGDRDPHSPQHAHWVSIQMVGYGFRKISGKHAGRLLRSKWHVWFHHHYWKIYGPIFFLPFFILPFDVVLTVLWAPVATCWQLQSLANTWGHNWGKNDLDQPHNSLWLFPFILGDCWHGHHHDRPGKIRFHRLDPIGWLGETLFKESKSR